MSHHALPCWYAGQASWPIVMAAAVVVAVVVVVVVVLLLLLVLIVILVAIVVVVVVAVVVCWYQYDAIQHSSMHTLQLHCNALGVPI